MKWFGNNGRVWGFAGMNPAFLEPMIFSTLKIYPSARQRAQVLGILGSVRNFTRTLPDCLGCWLDDGGYLGGAVLYAEQWDSEEALHQHLRSDLYNQVLVAMEYSTAPPEVHFHYTSEAKGMELIEGIRGVSDRQSVSRT